MEMPTDTRGIDGESIAQRFHITRSLLLIAFRNCQMATDLSTTMPPQSGGANLLAPLRMDVVSGRLTGMVRILLFLAAAHAAFQIPGPQLVHYLSLMLVLYAGGTYWLAVRESAVAAGPSLFWVDAAGFLLLSATSAGELATFSFALSFPVVAVLVVRGTLHGLVLLLACFVALLLIGLSINDRGSVLPLGQWVLGAVCVVTLVYFVTDLARAGVDMRRQLKLISGLKSNSNFRLGLDAIVRDAVEVLCRHFEAECCTLVLAETKTRCRVFQYSPNIERGFVAGSVPLEAAAQLLVFPEDLVVGYNRRRGWYDWRGECFARDVVRHRGVSVGKEENAGVAEELGCKRFMTAPVRCGNRFIGRIFVGAKVRRFSSSDVYFMCKVMAMIAPDLENTRLLDRLAAEAAEHERNQIGRDLHDSAIQPYIGLKFGLEALARKVGADDPLRPDIERLTEMVSQELLEMRRLVRGLRTGAGPISLALEPRLRRQAVRFGELFGIDVTVNYACHDCLPEQLAAEAMHAVSEALSNIRRHTRAGCATIHISCEAGWLVLRIRNPHDRDNPPKQFQPRSLSERARALGGYATIEISENSTTLSLRFPI